MPAALDVIVVAGDRQGSRLVNGESKIFLPLAGAPVLHHVLSAVERARCTGRIVVVGDRARIEHSLATATTPYRALTPLIVVDQGDTLYANVWAALRAILGPDAPHSPAAEDLAPAGRDTAVLVVTGDAPLLVPAEIDELVAGADLDRFDYCLGITGEDALRAYAPRDGRPGIVPTYFNMRDLPWRQNNLHLLRPFAFRHRGYVDRAYALRHQRDWRNTFKIAAFLWRSGVVTPAAARAFLSLQLGRLIRQAGLLRSGAARPFLIDRPHLERAVSALIGARFTFVETHYGGGALDVDDAEAYDAIRVNFAAWQAHQARLAR